MPQDRQYRDQRPIRKDRQSMKAQDIKRSLVHRARLRKSYFKLLEREEESAPAIPTALPEDGAEEESSKTPAPPKEKPMTYGERAQLIKDRKLRRQEESRQKRERQEVEKREKIKQRETHKKQMTKYTRKGQPVMGPRINRLLDKVRDLA